MKIVPTTLNDVFIVEAPVFTDDRGFFTEVYQMEKFGALGLPVTFVQDNHSRSTANVLRGLHFQYENPQGKLVRAVTGQIYDVAVDLRRSSSTFRKWFGVTLTEADGRQLWIPPGFAHGFLVLSEVADVSYKCTTLYNSASDAALLWNDDTVAIEWPLNGTAPLVSAKGRVRIRVFINSSFYMKRILLFGASGQVGNAIACLRPNGFEIVAPSSQNVDMRHGESVRAAVVGTGPDAIINCAAFTRVDEAETAVADAHAINAETPRLLAEFAAQNDVRLLHISTDYVFDGTGGAPFGPGALASPINQYGASKLAGEQAVLEVNSRAAVIRTAWVHAGRGTNFVATAVRVLSKGGTMRVVDDQVSTPTQAKNLAALLWQLVDRRDVTGLLHFTDAGVASWYDVADCVLETLVRTNKAGPGAAVIPVESKQFPRPAKRPSISLLDKHATWDRLALTPVHWRVGVIASTLELLNA